MGGIRESEEGDDVDMASRVLSFLPLSLPCTCARPHLPCLLAFLARYPDRAGGCLRRAAAGAGERAEPERVSLGGRGVYGHDPAPADCSILIIQAFPAPRFEPCRRQLPCSDRSMADMRNYWMSNQPPRACPICPLGITNVMEVLMTASSFGVRKEQNPHKRIAPRRSMTSWFHTIMRRMRPKWKDDMFSSFTCFFTTFYGLTFFAPHRITGGSACTGSHAASLHIHHWLSNLRNQDEHDGASNPKTRSNCGLDLL